MGCYIVKRKAIEKLGQGSMATIYKGYQPSMERHVAIKVMSSALAQKTADAAMYLKYGSRHAP